MKLLLTLLLVPATLQSIVTLDPARAQWIEQQLVHLSLDNVTVLMPVTLIKPGLVRENGVYTLDTLSETAQGAKAEKDLTDLMAIMKQKYQDAAALVPKPTPDAASSGRKKRDPALEALKNINWDENEVVFKVRKIIPAFE